MARSQFSCDRHKCTRENILVVTGCTGKSGAIFLQCLSDHAETIKEMFPGGVRLLVRSPEKAANWLDKIPHSELSVGDLTDENYLRDAMRDGDTVVHIAWIMYSEKIVEAAITNNVRRLILVHTTGIYSKYKAVGEGYRRIDERIYAACKDKGILLTILRPTMIYGNTSDRNVIKFIKMVDRLPVMPVVNGAYYMLQPVHYADLGQAYYDVLTHEKETAGNDYNLSGGEEIELREMLAEMGRQLGKEVTFISVPFPLAYAGAWGIYLLTFGKIDLREKVQRLCEPRIYSHAQATADFGYRPRKFAAGIRDEIIAYRELK